MARIYSHGPYAQEQATSLIAPKEATAGLQVIVGTAPVNMLENPQKAVNVPLMVGTYKEAVESIGYSGDFDKYTLCESVYVNFNIAPTAPLILINVLDPKKHSKNIQETTVTAIDGIARIEETGLLPGTLTVTNNGTELEADVDYTVAFNNDGTLNIVLMAGGNPELTITGKKLDPSLVTYEDIIGGVDVDTGEETGLEVIRQIYPKFSLVPGIITAPRWSRNANVSAAMQAKTKDINGVFRCVCVVDIDSSPEGAVKYADVKKQKERQAVNDANAYAVWPYAKVGDQIFSGSALASALTAYTDGDNGNVPNVSPSNKALSISAACLPDGTELLLDQEQANVVNSYGVATFLNMNGWRLWGNNTAVYPSSTDPKDRWFAIRRFMSWAANTFILTYFQKVDNPMNSRLKEAIIDSENIRGNSFVARGICARYEMVYLEEENPTTSLMNGVITFHQYITPYTPAEDIENIIEFDPYALSSALLG